MDKPKLYALACALLISAFLAGKFSVNSAQSKSSEQTQKVVNIDQNVVEVTKETRSPDGTVVKETRKEKETITQRSSETSKVSSQTIDSKPSYRVGVLYEPAINGLQKESGALIVERRLFSELYLGVSVSSNKTIGIGLSLGF